MLRPHAAGPLMLPSMYPVTVATLPTLGSIHVPRYEIEAFDGKTLYLSLEPTTFTVDIAQVDSTVITDVLQDTADGFELRGVLAVAADLLNKALNSSAKTIPLQTVGTVLNDTWYAVKPVDSPAAPRVGSYILVGLYR